MYIGKDSINTIGLLTQTIRHWERYGSNKELLGQ